MKYGCLLITMFFLCLVQSCFKGNEVDINVVPKKSYGNEIQLDFSESHDVSKVKWVIPSSWTPMPHNSLLKARFKIAENCFITISSFPGLAGGLLNNINRWREQLSLKPINITQLSEICDTLKTSDFNFTLVLLDGSYVNDIDLNYIYAGIFYYDEQTWFVNTVGSKSVLAPLVSDIKKFMATFRSI